MADSVGGAVPLVRVGPEGPAARVPDRPFARVLSVEPVVPAAWLWGVPAPELADVLLGGEVDPDCGGGREGRGGGEGAGAAHAADASTVSAVIAVTAAASHCRVCPIVASSLHQSG